MLKGPRTGTHLARIGRASISEFENQTSRQLEGLLVIRSLKVQLER
jgi:hypothetical protein